MEFTRQNNLNAFKMKIKHFEITKRKNDNDLNQTENINKKLT
jgi:hypothetical protein